MHDNVKILSLNDKFIISFLFCFHFHPPNQSEGMCKAELSINKGFCEVPWLGEYASVNDGHSEGFEDRNSHFLHSCSFEEFKRFHSFYEKFLNAVREFFLPPERHRFGMVSDRSMLSSVGVGDSGSWFAVHYRAGCSSCSSILKEDDDLNYVLQMNNYFVKEVNKTFLTFVPCFVVYIMMLYFITPFSCL